MPSVPRPRPDGQPRRRKAVRPAHGSCRLTLTINGTSYAVRPLSADPSAALQLFRLRKTDGTVYHVARQHYGAECDCPDFIFHRDGLDPTGCKHIKALAACGLIDPPPAVRPDASTWPAWTDELRWTVTPHTTDDDVPGFDPFDPDSIASIAREGR